MSTKVFFCNFFSKREEGSLFSWQQKTSFDIWCLVTSRSNEKSNYCLIRFELDGGFCVNGKQKRNKGYCADISEMESLYSIIMGCYDIIKSLVFYDVFLSLKCLSQTWISQSIAGRNIKFKTNENQIYLLILETRSIWD